MTLKPHAALTVPPETTIGDCIRKMRAAEVGSVLIVSGGPLREITGIFTERDVLHWVDEIQHQDYWNKAVAGVMKRPVITIGIEELDQAGSRMLDHGFRHLPVTFVDPKTNQTRLAGVISMRDLFRETVIKQIEEGKSGGARRALLLADEANPDIELLTRLIRQKSQNDPEFIAISSLMKQPHSQSLKNATSVVVDLDAIPLAQWNPLLQRVSKEVKPGCQILITIDSGRYERRELDALEQSCATAKAWVFSKPINVFGFLARI